LKSIDLQPTAVTIVVFAELDLDGHNSCKSFINSCL
jgi:hypothetical protein